MDQEWRKMRFDLDGLKKTWNEIQNQIKAKKIANK